MNIKMIVAVSRNGVIGKAGNIPWKNSEDMSYFKEMTCASSGPRPTVVMGRKTWNSIPTKFRPLPDRHNIVVSRTPEFATSLAQEGACAASSVEEAIEQARSLGSADCWLIGGVSIYQAGLQLASEIHLTLIPQIITGDDLVHFPWLDHNTWLITQMKPGQVDPTLQFIRYSRKE